MTTFDSWEVGICLDEDYLMHWGIPGMKHGRRRYQNEDGTWTSIGLAERRKREGFGEDKRVAKAQKRIARAEKHQARKAARMEARQVRAEKKRMRSLKGLTDEELQKKINRVKMEQEYKELTRSPLLKSGERLVTSILDYKANKEQRIIDLNRQKVDMMRAQADRVKAKEGRKRAKQEAKKARYENRGRAARKKAKTELINAKKEYKNYTIRGGIARRINMKLTSGTSKSYETIRNSKAKMKVEDMERRHQIDVNEEKKRRAADAARDAQREADRKKRQAEREARNQSRQRDRRDRRNSRKYGYDYPLN